MVRFSQWTVRTTKKKKEKKDESRSNQAHVIRCANRMYAEFAAAGKAPTKQHEMAKLLQKKSAFAGMALSTIRRAITGKVNDQKAKAVAQQNRLKSGK